MIQVELSNLMFPKISVKISGQPTREDHLEFEKIIDELNELMESSQLYIIEDEAIITVYYVTLDGMPKIEPNYVSESWGFFWTWWENYSIYKARVLINIDISFQYRVHLLREELTQSLGLINDSYIYPDSIFQQDWTDTTTWFTEIDRKIIHALYMHEIVPGMTVAEARNILLE